MLLRELSSTGQLFSFPVDLGVVVSNPSGSFTALVTITGSTDLGVHHIVFSGPDRAGNPRTSIVQILVVGESGVEQSPIVVNNSNSSNSSSSAAAASGGPANQQIAPPAQPAAPAKLLLARTGAESLGLAALAALLMIAGAVMVRPKRQDQE